MKSNLYFSIRHIEFDRYLHPFHIAGDLEPCYNSYIIN